MSLPMLNPFQDHLGYSLQTLDQDVIIISFHKDSLSGVLRGRMQGSTSFDLSVELCSKHNRSAV